MTSAVSMVELAVGSARTVAASRAEDLLEDFIRDFPDSPLAVQARVNLAKLAWKAGEIVKAREVASHAHECRWSDTTRHDLVTLYLILYVTSLTTGNVEDARTALDILRKNAQDDMAVAQAHFEFLQYLAEHGMEEMLKEELEKFKRAAGYNPVATAFIEKRLNTARDLSVGKKPYDIKGTTIGEKEFSLSSFSGKVVVINFFASRSEQCGDEADVLESLYGRLHGKGLEIVSISLDYGDEIRDNVLRFVLKHGIDWPVLFDEGGVEIERANRWGIEPVMLPTNFVIGRDGKIRYKRVSGEALELVVERTLNEPVKK